MDAEQCNGAGGSVVAMGFQTDPCPASAQVETWVILVASIGGAVLLLLCLVVLVLFVRRANEEEWDDED